MAVEVKHSRRGSFEYEDLPSIPQAQPAESSSPTPSSQRTRVQSNPNIPPLPGHGSASAGPYRTSFNVGTPNGHSHAHSHSRSGSISANGTGNFRTSVSSSSGRPSFSSSSGNGIPIRPHGAHARSPSLSSEVASPTFRSSFSSVNNDMAAWKNSLHDNNSHGNASSSSPPLHNSPVQSKRHSRIHSRNLSIFFPRPGVNAVSSIAEDGAQEIEAPASVIPTTVSTPRSTISTPQSPPPSSRSQLGGSFKFGGRPPQSASSVGSNDQVPAVDITNSTSSGTQLGSVPMSKAGTPQTNATQTSSRRGHHHRHSLSHSFFSFMEPSPSFNASSPSQHRRQPSSSLSVSITGPTPPTSATPLTAMTASGWGPISPFVASATSAAFPPAQLMPPKRTVSLQPAALPSPSTQRSSTLFNKLLALPDDMKLGLLFGVAEAAIGCGLWVMGQHVESLACTGLAYWVVFDAISAILAVYGGLVDAGSWQGSLRLPYGAKRRETVALFAQAIYLLFSAVYICKETIEHALLSMGDAGHHHHHPEGAVLYTGLNYPSVFLWLSFVNLCLCGIFLDGNAKILDATGIQIPSPRQLFRSLSGTRTVNLPSRPPFLLFLSNPYTLFPLICTILLLTASILPLNQDSQRTADMLIAGIEAAGTACLAWPACLTLGKVLLQMAPERSAKTAGESLTTKGTMESLLRAMKEIERHPQVLHLPAPHVWQVSPASTLHNAQSYSSPKGKFELNGYLNSPSLSAPPAQNLRRRGTIGGSASGQVIVTVELHVRKELEDVECLELTRWAWQRCINALGQGEEGVSVGIVRG